MATYYMGLDSAQSSNSAVHARDMTASPVPAIPGAPSYQTSSQLGTLPSLFVGVGGILSVLLAQCTGTRFVMVLDSALLVATLVWCAAAHGAARGLYSHIAARCIMGLCVGSVESLVPLILRDLHYVHERNSRIVAMWASGVRNLLSHKTQSQTNVFLGDLWRSYWYCTDLYCSCTFMEVVLLDSCYCSSRQLHHGSAFHPGDDMAAYRWQHT